MQPFYGRRLSRSISKLEISNLWDEDFFLKKTNVLKKIKEVKSQFNFFNLEIGFGAGDNSAHQAFLKKDECFIACDP